MPIKKNAVTTPEECFEDLKKMMALFEGKGPEHNLTVISAYLAEVLFHFGAKEEEALEVVDVLLKHYIQYLEKCVSRKEKNV